MRAKKVIVGVAISAMLISSSIPVMAFSVTNGNKTFDKKWELSTTSDGGKGVLTYGYNTLAINEDYAHAYHSTKDHYAYVKNGNGSFSGSNVGKGNWSKIELLIKEIVLPTVIATKQRFGIMAEWLEFQPLLFVECI